MICVSREKRTAPVQALIFPSTKERVKELLASSKVTSMSDYLFELIERDLHDAEKVKVVKQKIGGRIGRN